MLHSTLFFRLIMPLTFCCFSTVFSNAQTVLFQENMGVPLINTPVNSYTGFQNYGSGAILFSSSSTTDVRGSSASSTSYYASASGGGNIFINDTSEDFQVSGIDIDGYGNLSLSFGLWKGSTAEDGTNLTIEIIIDGSSVIPVPLTLPTGSGTAIWHYQIPAISIPVGSTLGLRFNGEANSAFRIDDIVLTGTDVPVPVTLTYFKAVKQGKEVVLEWETAQERNSRQFEIERSSDGKKFSRIATVLSENNPEGSHYMFTDREPREHRSYYRLKILDFDEGLKYSMVRAVYFSPNLRIPHLLGNPVAGTLKIKIPDDFNYLGHQLYTRSGKEAELEVRSNGGVITADVSHLKAGVYFISLSSEINTRVLKFVKQP